MLTRQENELLTRTDAGTPMGATMRRYWLPAMLSWELPEPDCPPVRVGLLGERLVGFRDTRGRVGLLEELCPHRRASLWLGRNEESGLRCVFHGWKYDVDGHCVDQMNEPKDFKDKVHARAYPTVELGGVIWAYMGPPDKNPPPPRFEWTQAPESHRHVTKVVQECNWLQGLEGGVDVSHVPILHRTFTDSAVQGYSPAHPFVRGGGLRVEVDETDYGYRYFGVLALGEDETYVRGYHYIMPFAQVRPDVGGRIYGHYWVPVDDEHCMAWNWYYTATDEPLTDGERAEERFGNGPSHVDQATFRSHPNASNDYLLDRQAQKHRTFTGIDGLNAQDRAVQETMGPISDRTREHLGPADKTIIAARKLLLEAVRTVQDGGTPRGASTESYYPLRAAHKIVPRVADWRQAVLPDMYPAGVP